MNHSQATKRFYDLVWPQRAVVFRAARIHCGNDTEADDLAQETLIKAFKAIDSFADGSNLLAWLMTILRHTRIDRLRSSASLHQAMSLEEMVDEPAGPQSGSNFEPDFNDPQQMLSEFSDEAVIAALANLPEEIRWTLLLVDVEELDHKEASVILGVPVGTVKSRMHRGRAMVRESLAAGAKQLVLE